MKRNISSAAFFILLTVVFISCQKSVPDSPGNSTPILTHTISPTITTTPTITITPTFTVTPVPPAPPASTCAFGATSANPNVGRVGGFVVRLSRYYLASSSTILKIAFCFYCYDDYDGSAAAKVAIYTDSATNTPGTRVTSTVTDVALSGYGWNTVDITPTLLSPGYYWLGVYASYGGLFNIAYDNGALGGWYSGTAWPVTWSGGASNGTTGFAIRAICQ